MPAVAIGRRQRQIRGYLLAFIACVLIANAVLGDRGAIALRRARHEHHALASSMAAIRAENARLRTEARLLRADRRTIEAVARRELGLAAPGEHVVLVTTRTAE